MSAAILLVALALMVPLLRAAGMLLRLCSGVPYGIAVTVAGVIVTAVVALGGMRSATRVQALHFWVSLCAIAVVVLVLFVVAPQGGTAAFDGVATVAGTTAVRASVGLEGTKGGDDSLLYTVLAPGGARLRDRRSATGARTVLLEPRRAAIAQERRPLRGPHLSVPARVRRARGARAQVRHAAGHARTAWPAWRRRVLAARAALAAVVGALVGLLVAVSATLAHDVLPRAGADDDPGDVSHRGRWRSGRSLSGSGSRRREAISSAMVGWAFVFAASTVFPLTVLGAWFRGLTKAGAIAGMLAGGGATIGSAIVSEALARRVVSAPALLVIAARQPAILIVPLVFGLMIVVSRSTRSTVPADADDRMLRLHAPEQLGLDSEDGAV